MAANNPPDKFIEVTAGAAYTTVKKGQSITLTGPVVSEKDLDLSKMTLS